MTNTFHREIFQRTLDSYLRKWFLFLHTFPFCIGFSIYTVIVLNRGGALDFDLPFFLYPSHSPSVFYRLTSIFGDSEWVYVLFSVSFFGMISMGPVAVGVVAIGGFSVGIFAIGRGTHGYGKAVGIVSISCPAAYGVYTLSYRGGGTHMFSPDRHDAVAVAFFTRWLPKFKKVFEPSG